MKTYEKFLKHMPIHKIEHSFRVAESITSLHPNNKEAILIALFHDYVEQGGSEQSLSKIGLDKDIIQAVLSLTAHDSDPLSHIKKTLPVISTKVKNLVILVKLCDRADNLEQRLKNDTLTKSYLEKSEELAEWLFTQYSGEQEHLFLIRKRMKATGCCPKKKYINSFL